MYRGKVKWFNAKKGYGFLITENTEIFVHYSGLNMDGFKTLKPGQTVSFAVIDTEIGKQAVNVTVVQEDVNTNANVENENEEDE